MACIVFAESSSTHSRFPVWSTELEDDVIELRGDRFGVLKAIQNKYKKAKMTFHYLDGMYVPSKQ